jgi:hypothetical protein
VQLVPGTEALWVSGTGVALLKREPLEASFHPENVQQVQYYLVEPATKGPLHIGPVKPGSRINRPISLVKS